MSGPRTASLSDLAARLDAVIRPLWSEGLGTEGPVGIAVSGGSDSLALLLAAHTWARARGRTIVALSIDHGLRPEAGEEIARVAALCARLGVAHRSARWAPPAKAHGIGQAEAREARYGLLAGLLRVAGGSLLLTGHTSDDQAETALMRATHGSPVIGLGGMRTVAPLPVWPEGRGVVLVRPLLPATRLGLRQMLAGLGLDWVEDPSNADPKHERVRVRVLLAAQPELRAHALRLVGVAQKLRRREDRSVIALMGQAEAMQGGVLSLPRDALRRSAPGAMRRTLTDAIAIASGTARRARSVNVERLAHDLVHGDGRPATLGGAIAWTRAERIWLARDPGQAQEDVAIVPGGSVMWDGRFEFHADAGMPAWRIGVLDPARTLPENLRDALRALTPLARGSQPALFHPDGTPAAMPHLLPLRSWKVSDHVALRAGFMRKLLEIDASL